jgi:hypothetical protein
MSAVDIKTLKQGDAVLVRCAVMAEYDPVVEWIELSTGIAGAKGRVHAHAWDLVSVDPRPLLVGDRVKHSVSGRNGEIICMYGRCAWVLFAGDTEGTTAELQYLVRA